MWTFSLSQSSSSWSSCLDKRTLGSSTKNPGDFTLTEGPPKLSLEDFFGLGAESGPLYEGISHPLQNLAPFPR